MEELKLLSAVYLLFVVLIAAEQAWSKWRADGGYRWAQFVTNIGHGMIFQASEVFTKALTLLPFLWLAEHAALAELPVNAWWAWLVGLLAYDFLSYWRHRHHHEIAALWAIHGVHHAAEDYNFAAALRQALFGNVLGWLWMVPLALFMPIEMYVGLIVFDYVYQFVQHTRYVPKLGLYGLVFNTPSHHRVHHGVNEHYLDRNYGGILISWDRLFGTFQAELDEPVYGLTKPIGTMDPLWGNLVLFADLFAAARRTTSWRDAVTLFLSGPGAEDHLAPGGPVRARDAGRDADLSLAVLVGALTLFFANGLVLVALIWTPADMLATRIGLALLTVLGAIAPATILARASRSRVRSWRQPRPGPSAAAMGELSIPREC